MLKHHDTYADILQFAVIPFAMLHTCNLKVICSKKPPDSPQSL